MRAVIVVACLLLPVSGIAHGPDLLSRLSAQIHYLGSLPPATPTHAPCPDHLATLNGLSKRQLTRAPGRADFIHKPESNATMSAREAREVFGIETPLKDVRSPEKLAADSWTYSLASPIAPVKVVNGHIDSFPPVGGRTPELTFIFGAGKRVVRVTCSYPR